LREKGITYFQMKSALRLLVLPFVRILGLRRYLEVFMSKLSITKQHKCFSGEVLYCTVDSTTCCAPMNFSIFVPNVAKHAHCPVLLWLSGITCTEDNFMVKSGVQRTAGELGMIVVCPDTSPRTANIPGESDSWDLGLGAGFYVDATQAPWSPHYQMYRFVSEELPALIDHEFATNHVRGIAGHSMGGHGALVVGMRNPQTFRSISAFAPICSPPRGPLGAKAFRAYLGENEETWQAYDATYVIKTTAVKTPILVHQGDRDHLLRSDLQPELLVEAARSVDYPLTLEVKEGFDHSYFFVATFMDEHLRYHARALNLIG
jgi:S-formylglutathione hydrolase